jgi:hypothetical protein
MDLFTRDDLRTLLAEHVAPCVSLFMPSRRGGAEQDPVRWRKHLAEAEERLSEAGWRAADAREWLAPGRTLLDDPVFWRQQSDGLAAFLGPEFVRLYRLPLAFRDLVVVGGRFYITPLLPLLGGDGRFYVLALSHKAVRLLQGTRDGVSEVDLAGVPHSMAEALLAHDPKKPFTFYGRRRGGADAWGGIFHGHGVGLDDAKDELLQYFHRIDRGLHPVLREEKAPLVLAAVEYLQPIYRQANTYPHLLEKGVDGNPDRLSAKELHDRAWPLVLPLFEAAQRRAAAEYRRLAGTASASNNLEAAVAAAHAGRMETLFVALGHQVWGAFEPASGRVERHGQRSPGDVEFLDLAAADALAHGGTVYAVEPGQVPGGADLAAVFRHAQPKHGKRP